MRTPRTSANWAQVQERLHPALRHDPEIAALKWHRYADTLRSSQSFCVSAFCRLRQLPVRDQVLNRLFGAAFGAEVAIPTTSSWTVRPEVSDRSLLSEVGGQPTAIDALCTTEGAVVAIESKLVSDAADGFGGCSRPVMTSPECRGYYGPGGPTLQPTDKWCALEIQVDPPSRRRSAREYWTVGRSYFQPTVFEAQLPGDDCPFKGPHFQLMRNWLFAAAWAHRAGHHNFGVLVMSPRATSTKLLQQLEAFRDEILLSAFRERIRLAYYEEYIENLRIAGEEARNLAEFLSERLNQVVG